MITPFLVVFVLISLVLVLMGSIVLLRNIKAKVNRSFFVLVTLLASWMLANYFSNDDNLTDTQVNVANHLVLFFAGLAIVLVLRFVAEVTNNSFVNRHLTKIAIANYVVMMLTLTPWMIEGISRQGEVYAITFGPAALPYFAFLLADMLLIIGTLIVGVAKSRGEEKSRAAIILTTIGTWLLINIITNALLPIIAGSFSLTNLGPMTSVILAGGFAYAIARHRLFDIRPVIARAAGYVFSIMALASLYGLLVFGLAQAVFGLNLSLKLQIFFSFTTGIAALSFHYLKQTFDRITNKLFYRDAYDPEILFDDYNKTLVSTIDLDQLLRRTSSVIVKHLKVEYCAVGVKERDGADYRVIGTNVMQFRYADIAVLNTVTPYMRQASVLTDDLPAELSDFKDVLIRSEVSLLVRLANHKNQEGLGYLILGPKKSGNPYTNQDISVIETLANELFIALQNALRFEEIERFNETLQQKVDQATRQLRESNKKLKKLNDSKDDFIGMASHQLRTPLTSIKGYISLVADGDAGKVNATQHKLLTQAFTSSQKMVYLIADLLNVSRLKTGKFTIERKPTNLATLIDEEMAQLKEEAAARGLELKYEAPKEFPVLPLDETKTRQVVMNFLDNAIYYTPNGGHILAELRELPNSVEFRVTDDGIGVPKAERHQLFTKFYRAKNAQRARPDGTGLGLYMAQKVVAAQGGAIIFDSTEGKGSTFGFTFPKDMPEGQVPLPALTKE